MGIINKAKTNLTAYTIRTLFKSGDDKKNSGLSTPDTIQRDDNIPYDNIDKLQMLDVYRPKSLINNEKKLPVIVNVHGGGWVYGTKETYQFYCMSLSEYGFAVVNFSYRLAPEFKYPAQIEDVNLVFKWIYENKDKYNFDINNVFAVGDSAGAHLLSLYCCMLTNENYVSNIKINLQKNIIPNAVALNCGCYRIYKEGQKKQDTNFLLDCLLENATDENRKLISPDFYINEKFPNTFIMSCFGDILIDDYKYMKEVLENKGVKVVGKFYGTEKEKLFHVFHTDLRNPVGKLCNKEQTDFFKENIK